MAKFNDNKKPMNFGARKKTFENAEKLRENMTEAESILWNNLRGKQLLNLRFRRQHPIGQFIVDFYCHTTKLVIEIDGKIHNRKDILEYDKERTFELNKLGLDVFRFTNDQVINNIEYVIKEIKTISTNKLSLPD